MIYQRNIQDWILAIRQARPSALVMGSRGSGKTTLMQQLCQEQYLSYVSLEDLFHQAYAKSDPVGFIRNLPKPVILEEVQRVPEIFLPLKKDIATNRTPGQYILTGSANPLAIPKIGDYLAGRIDLISLWPLSQGELRGVKEGFIKRIFDPQEIVLPSSSFSKKELIKALFSGGFPELQNSVSDDFRYSWCNNYLTRAITLDILPLLHKEKTCSIVSILQPLASRASSIWEKKQLVEIAHIAESSIKAVVRAVALLENLFLLTFLPGWFKEPQALLNQKLYFVDTAILLHLLRANPPDLEKFPHLLKQVLENFIVGELSKQLTWSEIRTHMYHLRTRDDSLDVDLILQNTSGALVGIAIKAKETITAEDFKELQKLQAHVGQDFVRGIILYPGTQLLSLGKQLTALPISALWELK